MVEIVYCVKRSGYAWQILDDLGEIREYSKKIFHLEAQAQFDYVCSRLEDLSKRVQDLEAKANG